MPLLEILSNLGLPSSNLTTDQALTALDALTQGNTIAASEADLRTLTNLASADN